jgi:hypothetical protein
MIANANERRDPDGKLLLIRLALIKATDRRRYEQELRPLGNCRWPPRKRRRGTAARA